MHYHSLLALLWFLHECIVKANPSAPADSCWPTLSDLTAAIVQNPRYFTSGYAPLSSYRKLLIRKGWLEIGPCAAVAGMPWHRQCDHWRLTRAGLLALTRMDKEGCAGGCAKHRKIAGFKIAA